MSVDVPGDGPFVARFLRPLGDGATIARRNLIKITRVPDLLVFTTLSPIMFVLLFAYVFGSAISVPGVNYREFLMGGIFTQTVVFGATLTGTSLAADLQKGLVDRFRSLPIASSAVLVGRTFADVVNNILVIIVISVTGLLVGWRIRSSVWEALAGFALLLLFAYALSWVMAVVGVSVRSPEVVENASFVVIFPMTFIANTFVPAEGLPPALRVIAEWNPVSAVSQAVRTLFGNTGGEPMASQVWALQHPVPYVVAWVIGILVIFVPLAVRRYQSAVSR
jgi:ABC transporter DrrB family efflux protein